MSEYYVGEIIMFAGTYVPEGFLPCDGRSVTVSSYQVLFAVIGYTYGGSGASFNVPDMRSRVPVGQGQGTGLTSYNIGQQAGTEYVGLTTNQMPTHTHFVNCSTAPGTQASPAAAVWAEGPGSVRTPSPNQYGTPSGATMASNALQYTGASQAHPNIQPVLAVQFLINYNGSYPPRS